MSAPESASDSFATVEPDSETPSLNQLTVADDSSDELDKKRCHSSTQKSERVTRRKHRTSLPSVRLCQPSHF